MQLGHVIFRRYVTRSIRTDLGYEKKKNEILVDWFFTPVAARRTPADSVVVAEATPDADDAAAAAPPAARTHLAGSLQLPVLGTPKSGTRYVANKNGGRVRGCFFFFFFFVLSALRARGCCSSIFMRLGERKKVIAKISRRLISKDPVETEILMQPGQVEELVIVVDELRLVGV